MPISRSLFSRLAALIGASPLPRAFHGCARLWQRLVRPTTVGVRVVAVDQARCVLLVHHSYADGWHLPGGRVGRGETAETAAAREMLEETGLAVAGRLRLQGLHGRFGHGGSDYVAVYVATAWSGALRVDGLEIDDAGFFPLDGLPAGATVATRARLAEYCGMAVTSDSW